MYGSLGYDVRIEAVAEVDGVDVVALDQRQFKLPEHPTRPGNISLTIPGRYT